MENGRIVRNNLAPFSQHRFFMIIRAKTETLDALMAEMRIRGNPGFLQIDVVAEFQGAPILVGGKLAKWFVWYAGFAIPALNAARD